MILQKYIVESGFCSRREATELIKEGRVFVNGEIAEPGKRVVEGDEVEINGKQIKKIENKIYIKLNKPVDYTCTNKSFKNENNVYELISDDYRGLHIVGRLDKDSRGLVVLTNDGDFTQEMTHPSNNHEKEYEVEIMYSNLTRDAEFVDRIVHAFMEGIDIGEDKEEVVRAKNIQEIDQNKYRIVLTQGKKRQIRRMFSSLGCVVIDLKRVRIGDIKLESLKEGTYQIFKLIEK